eukprot:14046172-Alexandrium_andersonii.AAC.1
MADEPGRSRSRSRSQRAERSPGRASSKGAPMMPVEPVEPRPSELAASSGSSGDVANVVQPPEGPTGASDRIEGMAAWFAGELAARLVVTLGNKAGVESQVNPTRTSQQAAREVSTAIARLESAIQDTT